MCLYSVISLWLYLKKSLEYARNKTSTSMLITAFFVIIKFLNIHNRKMDKWGIVRLQCQISP